MTVQFLLNKMLVSQMSLFFNPAPASDSRKGPRSCFRSPFLRSIKVRVMYDDDDIHLR